MAAVPPISALSLPIPVADQPAQKRPCSQLTHRYLQHPGPPPARRAAPPRETDLPRDPE